MGRFILFGKLLFFEDEFDLHIYLPSYLRTQTCLCKMLSHNPVLPWSHYDIST